MACTIKFKDGTEMPEAEFYAWAMDNIDLKEFAKSGNIVFINKKEEAAKFSAIKKLAYNLQKGFQALFGNKVEIITDTEEIDRVLAGDRKNIKMQIDGKEVTVKPMSPEVVNGFYSPIEKTVMSFGKNTQKAKEWLNVVGKSDEAIFTGVRAFLEGEDPNAMVSKQEILDYMKNNRISVVEVVKEETPSVKDSDLRVRFDGNGFTIDVNKKGISGVYIGLDELDIDYNGENYEEVEAAAIQEGLSQIRRGKQGDETKFSQYQLEGEKENYKEVLVTLPKAEPFILSKTKSFDTLNYAKNTYGVNSSEYRSIKNIVQDELLDRGLIYPMIKTLFDQYESTPQDFKSTHFDEPNILVHLRMNTRTDADGNKVLFLEEVQSDWGQEGKKEGFESPSGKKKYEEFVRDRVDYNKLLEEKKEERRKLAEDEDFKATVKLFKSLGYFVGVNFKGDGKKYIYRESGEGSSPMDAVELKESEIPIEVKQAFDLHNKKTKRLDEISDKIKSYESKYGVDYDFLNEASRLKSFVGASRLKIPDIDLGGEVPVAPFVMDTNAWVKLGLKVALKEAVAQGVDKIAWTTGTQQFDRWGTEKIDWVKTNKGWTVNIQEQFRGTAFEGMNIDEKALSEKGISVETKEDLKAAIDRTLSREKNETEIQKLTDRIWDRMQKEDSGTSLPRKEGMESFYGTEGTKGIVGGVAEKLFGQKIGKTVIDIGENENYGKFIKDQRENDKVVVEYEGEKYLFDDRGSAQAWVDSNIGDGTTQSSIDITPELKTQVAEGQPMFMRDPKGKVLGFVYEGKIYIDPRTASPTTPIHEFGHIWNQYMKENHKAFYNRGIKLIKEEGGAYIEKVKKLYPELAEKGREADLYEEALAQAIGDKGRYIGKKNQNKFLSWLKDMWKLTKEGLKLSVSAETLSNMTLNEYTDLVAGSMLKGAEIATLLRAERTSQASTNPKFIKNAVKKLIATKDKVSISLSRLMGQLYKAESKGYANAVTTIKARIAASKAYQKKIIEYLNDRGIPITDKMKLEIAKVKDELSYANTMMKLIDMDNASIRLEQIGRIKKLIKAVKKLRKSKNLTSTDKSFINELDLPSVYEISDLDGYEELLGKLKRSLTGNVVLGIKNQFDEFITNEAEYINAYKESIAEIKKMIQTREWEEEYKYLSENNLLGGTNIKSKEDWISFKERLIDYELEEAERSAQEAKLNKIEENIMKKAELLESIKTSIKDLMSENKSELEEAFGEFNETSTPISYSDIFKNIDNLSYNQLVRLGNVLNNILSDEDFNGIGAFASLGRLNNSFQDVRREATKAISDKENKLTNLSERIAKSQTVSQIISEVTRGGASIEKLKNFIMGNWEAMISKVQSQYNKSFKEFKELSNSLFGKKAFEHWTRIDTYAFINQWVKYDETEEINRTIANRVKNRAKQHIDFLNSINPYDKNPNTALEKKQAIAGLKALQDFGVIKNLDLASLTYELEDDITPETLAGKLDEKEQRMYDFILNKFKDLSNYRSAMSINYDIDYDDIQNYFPTFPDRSYETEDAKIEDLEKSFVRFGKDNGRAKGRTKNLAKSYKIGLIENFSKGYWDALIIDMGSNELLDMSNILNNSKSGLDRLKEYGLNGDSIEILKKAIGEKVISEKNGGTVYGKAENALRMEAGRLISNIAAGLLLKGSNQIFKQAIPAMIVNFSLKPEAAALATRMLANSNFSMAVSNLIDSSTIKYRLNVYEINPSDLGFPVEYFDTLVGDTFNKLQGKGFSAIKAVESLQKIVSDPLYSLTKLVSKSNYDSFLEASDAYISKINILTAYIEHQKAAGKSFEDIVQELKSNKVNQSALKYAEKWQADLNSESKRVNMSKKLREQSILYYMRGFSLTTHQSFAQAVRKLGDKKLRSDMDEAEVESWKTTRNAFIMQQVMFRLVSTAVANWTISSLVQSITKSKPDDDEEEVVKVGIELAAAMVSDILLGSTSVIGTAIWAGVVNAIWAIASNKMVEQREEESIADPNKKKLQRPIANASQVGGAEVALINLITTLYFDHSMPSSEVAYAKAGGLLASGLTGSKEILDATRRFSSTLEREAKVSTLIDEELNTDLANYSYQISEEDKKTLVKELRNAPYNEIKTRVFFNKSSRELCVIPKDSYKKLMKDAAFELFGTRSEYLDVIRGTQAFKNLSSMKMQKFMSNAPLYANEIAYIRANTKGDIINNEEIKQLIRNRAKDIIERNIKGGTNPYGLSKYKVENIR